MSDFTNSFFLERDAKKLESFGFKLSGGGPHAGRTMMLNEITRLLGAVQPHSDFEQYKVAVLEQNVLGKGTASNSKEAFRRLRELYALSDNVPIFQIYRELLTFDPESMPLLSLIVVWARDPLFRATSNPVIEAPIGSEVSKKDLELSLSKTFPAEHSEMSLAKIARYASSSWKQSGHLTGHFKKIRTRVQPRPVSITLALLLGYVAGWNGDNMFNSPWCQLLDLNGSEAKSLATQAHREALIDLKIVGSIVDISFPRFNAMIGGLL